MPARSSFRPTTSALDISLLGVIVAAIAFYAGRIGPAAQEASPELVRFFWVSPDTVYVSPMPQDKALLLLTRTESSAAEPATATATATGVSPDPFWTLLFVAGLTLVVAGPVWAWIQRSRAS